MLKKCFPWILIAMTLVLNASFRLTAQWMPQFDLTARQEVYNDELKMLTEVLDKQYPSSDKVSRAALVKELFRQDLKDSRSSIDAAIAARAMVLKDRYRDESGFTYMTGIDSYYWLRYLKNLLATGHVGDRVVKGVDYDDLQGAEVDPAARRNVHLGLGWIMAKAGAIVAPGAPLEVVLFYLPMILSVVIAVVTFLVARQLGANDLGAVFASFVVHLSPFLLSRSFDEWFDTDIYNVLFPLLAFGSLLFVFSRAASLTKRLVFCFLSSLFIACYASTWKGWWFIFDIMVLGGLMFMLHQKQCQAEEKTPSSVIRDQFVSLACFGVMASLLVIVSCGFSVWKDFITEPLRLAHILNLTKTSLWPNVYLTVAELGPASAFEVVRGCAGSFVFFGSLLVFFYIFTFERGMRDNSRGYGFLVLALWIGLTFHAAQEASRFTLLLVVPTGIGFGLLLTRVYEFVRIRTDAWGKPLWGALARITVLVFFSLQIVYQAAVVRATVASGRPLMDDYWHRALVRIDSTTPKDSVVNSWWDYGHWFKAVAGRRILFDGMTQNSPVAYWIAQALLTSDERYAAHVLKMLNTTGNAAAEALIHSGSFDVAQSVLIIKDALAKDKTAALDELLKKMPAPLARQVHDALFPSKIPPVYYILSYDMVDKIGPISFIGNWDFDRVDLWFRSKEGHKNEFIAYAQKKLNLTPDAAQMKYMEVTSFDEKSGRAWFSTIEGYYSPMSPSTAWEGLKVFDNNLVMFSGNKSAIIATDVPNKKGRPQSVVFMENGALKEVTQEKPDVKFSAFLVEKKDGTNSLLCSPGLAKSMLLRLYFYKGEGLKYFKPWYQEVDDEGKGIYIYEMVWPE